MCTGCRINRVLLKLLSVKICPLPNDTSYAKIGDAEGRAYTTHDLIANIKHFISNLGFNFFGVDKPGLAL